MLNLPTSAAAMHQKYIRGCVLGWLWKRHSDISPTSPLLFTEGRGGVKNVQKFTKWSITPLWTVQFRSNLVQRLITWHPRYETFKVKGSKISDVTRLKFAKLSIILLQIVQFGSNLVQSLMIWHPMSTNLLRSYVKGQDHSVKTSKMHQIIALF